MDKNTKPIVLSVLFGSFVIALTVATVGRYQITGGPDGVSLGGSTYIVRDNWTGRSWFEQVRKH